MIEKYLIIALITLFGGSISSCNSCKKLKDHTATDYLIIYAGTCPDTLGTLTLQLDRYSFEFNPSFPDSLKKFAPPFIFKKPQGDYRWKSNLGDTCLGSLNLNEVSGQELEFDPRRIKPDKDKRFDLFTDNMNHRFGLLFHDKTISIQMGLNHLHWSIHSK